MPAPHKCRDDGWVALGNVWREGCRISKMKWGIGERTGIPRGLQGPTYTTLPGFLQGTYMPDKEDRYSQGFGAIIKWIPILGSSNIKASTKQTMLSVWARELAFAYSQSLVFPINLRVSQIMCVWPPMVLLGNRFWIPFLQLCAEAQEFPLWWTPGEPDVGVCWTKQRNTDLFGFEPFKAQNIANNTTVLYQL